MRERAGPGHRVARPARALGLAAVLAALPGAWEARAAPRVVVDPIALSTDAIPGWPTGARFGGFPDAIVNEAGDLAFLAGAWSSAVARGSGIWLRRASGETVEVARYSDPAPGVPSPSMGEFLVPALGDSGAVAFLNADSQGKGLGLWLWRDDGAPTLLAAAGSSVPESAQGAFTSIKAPPALNARGEVAFAAFTTFGLKNEGIWGPDGAGGLRLLARKGDPSPGGWPYRFNFVEPGIAPPSLNDAGEAAFQLTMRRFGPPTSAQIAQVVFGPAALGALTQRVGTDAPLPVTVLGAGYTLGSPQRGTGFHARGEIAFTAGFDGPDGNFGSGIWLSERSGRIVPIALGRDPAAGFPEGWYYDWVRDPTLGPAGHVAFRGTLRSLGTERGAATWRWDAATGAVPLAVAGDPAPGFPAGAELTDPSIVALNALGDVLFEDAVSTQAGVGPSVRTLFYAPARGRSFPVLREGDSLEVAEGEWRSVQRWLWSSQASGRRVLNDAGDIPLRVDFADGSSGLFVARVFARADRDADGVRDLEDVCADAADPEQRDSDANGVGDACNDHEDSDGDEFADPLDACPELADDQRDSDGDGAGDACDPFPNDADHETGQLRVALALAQETTGAVLAEIDRLRVAQDDARGEIAACLARRFFLDADADGEDDSTDRCPSTSPPASVDADGCSLDQFCADAPPSPALCNASDWLGDEPLGSPRDCRAMGHGCRAR